MTHSFTYRITKNCEHTARINVYLASDGGMLAHPTECSACGAPILIESDRDLAKQAYDALMDGCRITAGIPNELLRDLPTSVVPEGEGHVFLMKTTLP